MRRRDEHLASDPITTGGPAGTTARPIVAILIEAALALLLAALLAHAVYYLWVGIDRPIYEQHGFRQTQSALSAYWILHGGPWLAYETPVLGAPWSLPFEFPTYQLIVAALARLGVPLDQAGRLIAFGFFIATLVPLRVLLRELGYDRTAFLIVAVLFLACPLYVFWGRTFMIESTALFFGAAWLAAMVAFWRRGGALAFAVAIVAGSLAAVTKSTTFAGFGGVAGLIFLGSALGAVRSPAVNTQWRALLLLGSLCAVPLAAGIAWVVYADSVKLANPFAAMLTSQGLAAWNYGTLAQRLSAAFWVDVIINRMGLDIFGRVRPDLFGNALPLALAPVIVVAGLWLTRFDRRILIAIGAFLLPLLLFTNLYFHHNYYANANALFLLVAVGLSLAAIFTAGWRVAALLLLAGIVVGQVRYFRNTYDFFIRLDTRPGDRLQVAAAAKKSVPPDRALLVIGDDWSSGIPYLSERRALALVPFAPPALMEQALTRTESLLGGLRLGGIVTCSDLAAYSPQVQAKIDQLLAGRAVLAESGSCKLYPGE
jgi:hypothetical protein